MATIRRCGPGVRRAGFTLTELLAVISTITVLVGLTFAMFTVAQREIDQLQGQVALAHQHVNKKARPSRAKLGAIPNQYIVVFKRSVANPQAEAARLAQAIPAQVLHVYDRVFKGCAVRIQPGDVQLLINDPAVARLEQDQLCSICSTIPTGVSRIRFVNAPRTPPFALVPPVIGTNPPSIAPGGPRNLPGSAIPPVFSPGGNKAVAVIDSGIDGTHPDLNVTLSQGFGQPDGTDQNGHGTHVAGIIGSRGLGSDVVGVNPGVALWSLRVFDATGSGPFSNVIAALNFAAGQANQISVINMSLGGGFNQAVNDATDACVAAGITVCVAAGNSSADASGFSPASAPQAICVAALCDTDGLPGGRGPKGSFGDPDDTFASFSNFGATVSVIAPGEDILSTIPVSQGSFGKKSGTSMASPHVAGLASVVLANGAVQSVGGFSFVPTTNPNQVKGFLLTESVENIAGLAANKDGRAYPLITGRN